MREHAVIHVFIPDTQKGSAAAVMAHIKADTVFVHRCDETNINDEIGRVLHWFTVHYEENLALPRPAELWIFDFNDSCGNFDFNWEHTIFCTDSLVELWQRQVRQDPNVFAATGVMNFVLDVAFAKSNEDIALLYDLLEPEDFETLLVHMLITYPQTTFTVRNDFFLNMFVEKEKKRRAKLAGNLAQDTGNF